MGGMETTRLRITAIRHWHITTGTGDLAALLFSIVVVDRRGNPADVEPVQGDGRHASWGLRPALLDVADALGREPNGLA